MRHVSSFNVITFNHFHSPNPQDIIFGAYDHSYVNHWTLAHPLKPHIRHTWSHIKDLEVLNPHSPMKNDITNITHSPCPNLTPKYLPVICFCPPPPNCPSYMANPSPSTSHVYTNTTAHYHTHICKKVIVMPWSCPWPEQIPTLFITHQSHTYPLKFLTSHNCYTNGTSTPSSM